MASYDIAYGMNSYVNPTSPRWDYLDVTQYLDTWGATNEAIRDETLYQGDGFVSSY